MQDAIKKSIEGGWLPSPFDMDEIMFTTGESVLKFKFDEDKRPVFWEESADGKKSTEDESEGCYVMDIGALLIDPEFFRCLGKQQGWGIEGVDIGGMLSDNKLPWKWQMHRLIDHLAAGSTPDSFFNELLK